MSLRDELTKIHQKHGHINPTMAVAEVEKDGGKRFPTAYNSLEWDNDVAGPLYRVEQMRHLIKSVKIKYADPETKAPAGSVRAFYAVPSRSPDDAVDDSGYVWQSLEQVVSSPITTEILLREMQREIRELRARYGHLKEYRDILMQEAEAVAA